jgi:hypothetical protein
MKLKRILLAVTFVLPVLAAFATKAYHKRYPQEWHTVTGGCAYAEIPKVCGIAGTTVCTISGSTWYLQSNCTQAIVYDSNQ